MCSTPEPRRVGNSRRNRAASSPHAATLRAGKTCGPDTQLERGSPRSITPSDLLRFQLLPSGVERRDGLLRSAQLVAGRGHSGVVARDRRIIHSGFRA